MKNEDTFWIPKPQRFDFMTYAILIPVLFSAVGLVLMAIESYVFSQFASLPNDIRFTISVISAVLMAIGGELGSVANTVFIFIKFIRSKSNNRFEWDEMTIWDWSALIISILATITSFFIATSTRPDTNIEWQIRIADYFALPLVLLSVADVYSGMCEAGLKLGAFELEMTWWITKRKEEEENIKYLNSLTQENTYIKEEQNTTNKLLDKGQTITAAKLDDNIEIVPIPRLHCWCGKALKSKRAYNAHLRIHKNEAQQFSNPKRAYDELQIKYQGTITTADFEFPKLVEFAKWLTAK